MDQLHYIQLHILKKLLFAETLKFSDLKPFSNLENNQLSFHLDRLVKDGLIEKSEIGYRLTHLGKEFSNRMDTEKVKVEKQGKLSVIRCCVRGKTNKELLIYTRLKHPFYGSQGYPSNKIAYGETLEESARRELKEETNLEGDPVLFMIEHHLVYSKEDHKLLEDKYFFFCKIIDPTGELKANNEGMFKWVNEKDLDSYWQKPFESKERLQYITNRVLSTKPNSLTYNEITHFADNF